MRRLKLTPEQRLIHNTKQKIAQAAVRQAVSRGWLHKPSVCDECGQPPKPNRHGKAYLEAAHDNYNAPLDVRFLCQKCHRLHDATQASQVDDLEKLLPRPARAPEHVEWTPDHGYSLRALRNFAGVTQAELAAEAGVSQSFVSKTESGTSSPVAYGNRVQVIDALSGLVSSKRIEDAVLDSRIAILRRSATHGNQDDNA